MMNKIAILSVIAVMSGCAAPDAIEVRTGLHQNSSTPSICIGSGMSKHLVSKVGINALWDGQKDFSWQVGYSNEFCMLNEQSKTNRVFSAEAAYRFDL